MNRFIIIPTLVALALTAAPACAQWGAPPPPPPFAGYPPPPDARLVPTPADFGAPHVASSSPCDCCPPAPCHKGLLCRFRDKIHDRRHGCCPCRCGLLQKIKARRAARHGCCCPP